MKALNRSSAALTVRFCLVCSCLLLLLFVGPLQAADENSGSIETLRATGKAFVRIAASASPAVVGVKAEKMVVSKRGFEGFGDPFGDEFFDQFFHRRSPDRKRAPQKKLRQITQGSGFIISSEGYILTNNHLVERAEGGRLTVKLADGREFKAKVIGTDPESDVAVIKIDGNDLPTLELADSEVLEVGEWVLAIGNPFGLSQTVTAGIVSAKGRSGVGLATYEDFIQTDAAINPGNSGGPLINIDGKAVGINTAIIGAGGNLGIGFAIPINMAKSIYDQIVTSGSVVRGFLGVLPQDLTPSLAKSFDLDERTRGVLLAEVTPDSAADKAGLLQGDVIIKFDGKSVEKADDFRNRVALIAPGTEVKIVVLRNGKKKKFKLELDKRPGQLAAAEEETSGTLEQLGLSVQEFADDLAQRFGYSGAKGVIVSDVQPDSLAALAGIKHGMLIVEVDRKQILSVKEFHAAIEKAKDQKSVLLLINNGKYNRYTALQMPEEPKEQK